jgi:hypothetical protein
MPDKSLSTGAAQGDDDLRHPLRPSSDHADVMKRIAAPMIGGVITSGVLELLLYPVIYVLWRRRHLPAATQERTNATDG